MGLQEVVYPMQQDRLIGAAGEGQYVAHRAWAGRLEYGNSLLVRAPLSADEVERLDLGHNRSALRAIIGLGSGMTLLVAVTHLHHEVDGAKERDEQAGLLLEWLRSGPIADAHAVMGDFNAHPDEPAAQRMRSHGYRSAMAEANGSEPAVTWPSGIQAPGMDTDGYPACLDYIWIRGRIRVASAGLAFDRSGPGDPTLYPSDHFGLSADVELGLPDRREDR
jgi:endonuclease/exonuclease/phosphatase family metal-dependent hydrolase